MNNQKATNGLLIVLILLVLGFGGYYLYQNSQPGSDDLVTPTEDTDSDPTNDPQNADEDSDDTSDDPNTDDSDNESPATDSSKWTGYEDPVLGFSLEYPEDIFDAEPQGRGVDGGGVLIVAPDHSVPSDFSGQNPDKRQNLSIKFTVENKSMKMAIAGRDLQTLSSIPFNQAGHQGKLFLLGAEGINVQYGFLVIDANRTMVVEFNYYDKSVFGEASAEDFTREQQIEIFYAVLATLRIE